jgi:hypothetical protein
VRLFKGDWGVGLKCRDGDALGYLELLVYSAIIVGYRNGLWSCADGFECSETL